MVSEMSVKAAGLWIDEQEYDGQVMSDKTRTLTTGIKRDARTARRRRTGRRRGGAGGGGYCVPAARGRGRLAAAVRQAEYRRLKAVVPSVADRQSVSKVRCRRGALVSGVRRMNEVNARRARLLPGWVTVLGRVYDLGM